MFTHIFPCDRSAAADRPAQPSRFASAPAAAVPSSPRHSPGRLSAAAVTSPRANNAAADASRLRAGALPAFRLHRDRGAAARARRYHLPHVQHSGGERPEPAVYSSLEGLQRLTELFKGKHSTVATYLDARTGAVVAVKTYYKHTMAKRHFRNVRREVTISRLLARQRFTGAVQLLGAFEDAGHIFLVQEACTGDLYRRLVRSGGVLAEADVCRDVVVPLLLTLTFLHANHIVHRDIKPENMLFAADGGLRLGDFGLSIDAKQERPTSRVGTLDYMAPEVVGMPTPDDIKRLGLAPHQVGHYGCKVDVWAVGILTYELVCGRPPFEVEDVKLTEQHIQFAEVACPGHVSPACRSFIQQALTKRPESRPTAAQLFRHPWVQQHYRGLLAEQAQPLPVAAADVEGVAHTPELQLRRTASQPQSPSKSVPGGVARRTGGAAVPPTAVAAALAPFLPLSQAKQAHRVRLLSPGRPPNSARAVQPRRRVSEPFGRVRAAPAAEAEAVAAAALVAATATDSAAAAAAEAAVPEGPPTTPLQAGLQCAASDGTGAVAAAAELADDVDSHAARSFETPGTPGLKTTPLPRQRPVPPAQQRGLLGRMPFLLPQTPGSAGASTGSLAAAELQPLAGGLRCKVAAPPVRSRFAAAADRENDEGAASLRSSVDAGSSQLGSPLVPSRSASLTSFAKDGSAAAQDLAGRSNSIASFGGNSSGNLQLAARAGSFSSFGGGGSSGSLSGVAAGRAGSSSPVGKGRSRQHLLEGLDAEQQQAAEQLHRVQLA